MKKFFNKVKLDTKFRNAGEGHKLTGETPQTSSTSSLPAPKPPVRDQPLTAPQVNAAIAAMERQDKINCEGTKPKRRYKPATSTIEPKQNEDDRPLTVPETKQTHFSVQGIKFISALTEETFSKSELHNHYREQLILRLGSDEAILASCQMVHTLNKDSQKVEIGINTLCKYVDNLINSDNEEKFKKIRKGNKAFCERVSCIEGAEEFLKAIGFKLKQLQNNNEDEELFFVFEETVNKEKLNEYKSILRSTKPLVSKLYRDRKIYKPSNHALQFRLPDDFFKLTMEEVKREQELKTENVELQKQLRTSAMREAPRQVKKYQYSLIRIRLPDGLLLQGTFGVYEKLSAVRQFIGESITVEWAPFTLRTSTGQEITGDDKSLKVLALVPSVVLNLSWMDDVKEQLMEQGTRLTIKSDFLKNVEVLM